MITVKTFIFNFFRENTYLIYDHTNEAVLVDCGCMTQYEENKLSAFIEDNKLILKRLLCTHYHFDHVIGNAYIFHKYGIRPEMHKEEITTGAPTLRQQALRYGRIVNLEEIEPAAYIDDNEDLYFGNSVLKALLIPGHSPASLVFYSKDGRFVIAGDTLFPGSIGRTDLFGGDYNKLITGIQTKLMTLPDDTLVYSGHGPTTTIGQEKASNPYL